MTFKSLLVSPVFRPNQNYERPELENLKQEITDIFMEYGKSSCSYLLREYESSFNGYKGNFAIVDFQQATCAMSALQAIENGIIRINEMIITGEPIEMTYCGVNSIPDDCLLEIIQNLSLQEQLKLPAICQRWAGVAQYIWRKSVDLRNRSLLDTSRRSIIRIAPDLKDVHCDDYGFKIVGEYCKNLEKIALEFRRYNQSGKRRGKPIIQYERQTLQQFGNLTRLLLKIRIGDIMYFSFLQHLPSTMIEIHLFNDIKEIDLTRSKVGFSRDQDLGRFNDKRRKYGRKFFKLSTLPNLQALTLKCYHLDDNSLVDFEKMKKLICLRLDNCHLSKVCLKKLKTFTNLEHLSLKRVSMDYDDMLMILKRNDNLKYLALPKMTDDTLDNDIWLRALELTKLRVLCWTDIEHEIKECGASTSVEYVELNNVRLSPFLIDNFPNLKSLKRRGTKDLDISLLCFSQDRVNKIPFKYYHQPNSKNNKTHYFTYDCNSGNFQQSKVVSARDARIFRCNQWDGWYIEDSSTIDEEPLESTMTASAE